MSDKGKDIQIYEVLEYNTELGRNNEKTMS